MEKKYKIIIGIIIAIIIFGIIIILGNTKTTGLVTLKDNNQKELQEVNVRLPIPAQDSMFAQFYVAQELGYYEQEGLKVNFNLGSSELNPVKMVSTGTDDFGIIGGIDTFLVARSKGVPIKAIAVLHKNSNFIGIITLKDSGIRTVEQLEGKKIGFYYGHISTDVLRSLFKKTNTNVKEVDVGFNTGPLLSGQVDGMWTFITNPLLTLEAKGIKLNFISPKDYGITVHGYTVFTKEETINNNPQTVGKFWKATSKGIKYTLENPEEAMDIYMKVVPDTNREFEYNKLLIYNKFTSTNPIGYMDYEMFKETYDRLNELNVLEKEFDLENSYTTKFIE